MTKRGDVDLGRSRKVILAAPGKKISPCQDMDYRTLWEVYHNNPFDVIIVPRRPFEEVVRCHRQFVGSFREEHILEKIPARSATRVRIRRQDMFNFLVQHARCQCDNPLFEGG